MNNDSTVAIPAKVTSRGDFKNVSTDKIMNKSELKVERSLATYEVILSEVLMVGMLLSYGLSYALRSFGYYEKVSE